MCSECNRVNEAVRFDCYRDNMQSVLSAIGLIKQSVLRAIGLMKQSVLGAIVLMKQSVLMQYG